MPVSHIPSAETKKGNKSSYKRRKDQNSEIGELEALLPWSQKGAGIDKISVLRLTSTFIKFRDFWDSLADDSKSSRKPFPGIERLFSEAIDGFLIILASSGEVLYVSEGVADYVGVTQQEIIGLSVYELTHSDDHASIRDNLKAKGIKPQQFRQFYVRFKSSISPVKKQLSKFGGTIMLQVSGNLKISQRRNQYIVTGLVAECRRIESSSSILEVSIPQVMFTSITTMDLKILSVDTKMSTVTGFNGDIEGTMLTDFFHPSDNRRSIHCLKLLLITGQADSPIIRFMTHTGEWVWVQIQGLLRYEKDNKSPKYLEANFKLICASGDNLTMIEQKELYGKVEENGENAGIHADSRFAIPEKPTVHSPEAIVKAFEDANVSPAVRDVLLHSREEALMSIPKNMDRLASWGEVVEAVVEYEKSNGLPANYEAPYPPPPSIKSSPSASPLSSVSPSSFTSLPLSTSLPPSTDGSSIPLSHPNESSPPYLSPEPIIADTGNNQMLSSNLSSEISALCDVYIPSNGTTTSLANQFMAHTPNLSQVNSGSMQSPTMYPTQPAGNGITYGTQIPQQYNEPSTMGTPYNGANPMGGHYNGANPMGTPYNGANPMGTPYNGANPMGTPYNGANPMGTPYNGANPMGTPYNGANQMGTPYNGANPMGTQFNDANPMVTQFNGANMMMQPVYNGTMATQHNGPNTVATQFNGPGVIASQYNDGAAVANQYNNGVNVFGSQYNDPNMAATQFNNPGAMASQYNNPSAHAYQYNNTAAPNNQFNGVNVIANQYVGVQPSMHQNHNGPVYNTVPPAQANSFQQFPPTINMNVTINVPPVNGANNKIMTDQLSHDPKYVHAGKVESSVDHTHKSCLPYTLQGTFEVSHPNANWPSNGSQIVDDSDDILEALQLI